MERQKIPKVTPMMIREQPDQTASIINSIIDEINRMNID